MSDENTRQKAEEHYYAALDLMADGKLDDAVATYRESLAVDPAFTEAMHGMRRSQWRSRLRNWIRMMCLLTPACRCFIRRRG
jgi:hypothetical protein